MSLLSNAKMHAARGSVKDAFRNQDGAIDLASIMVGIIVIGLIGGVIAATVFAVIPWAQDNAAKQQLDSIAAAQSAYIGLSASANDGDRIYFGGASILTITEGSTTRYEFRETNATTLAETSKRIGGDARVTEVLFNGATADVAVGSTGAGESAHYAAAATSASGKVFYITDGKTQPTDDGETPATGWVKVVVDQVKR